MGMLRGLRAVSAGALEALAFAVNLPGIALAFVLLSLAGWSWPYGSPWRLVDEWREREEAKAREERERQPPADRIRATVTELRRMGARV